MTLILKLDDFLAVMHMAQAIGIETPNELLCEAEAVGINDCKTLLNALENAYDAERAKAL